MSWSLTIGGTDVSAFVQNGAIFTETASSSSGTATMIVNGQHAPIVNGAPVVLTNTDGVVAWEGSVSDARLQTGSNGSVTATLVRATVAASAFNVGVSGGSYQNNDVATLAQLIAANTSVPWGGPSDYGFQVGSLSFTQADDGLTTLSTLLGATWNVRNGQLQFVTVQNGIQSVPVTLVSTPNTVSTVNVLGGTDATARIPLSVSVPALGSPPGPSVYVAQPELSDTPTLSMYAGTLAEWYGSGSISAQAIVPSSPTVRAGDWIADQNGEITVAYTTQYLLQQGVLQLTLTCGFPALPVNQQYAASFADASARNPAARLHTDCVVSGCNLSLSGLSATVSAGAIILDSASVALAQQVLTLPSNGVVLIEANATEFLTTTNLAAPAPGTAIALYQVTTLNGQVLEQTDLRTHGGIGTMQLKPLTATSQNPSIASYSISLAAEGVASAVATISVTLAGVTLDDTVQSLDLTWSLAGADQWHPAVQAVRVPGSLTFTGYVHGLAAGQNYDAAVQVRGQNGIAYPSSPLLIGTSPSITGAAVANAIAANAVGFKQLTGDTSGNTSSPIVDGSNLRLLHDTMSTGVQGVVSSASGLNVNPVGGVTNELPYANHAAAVTNNLDSNGNIYRSNGFDIYMTPYVVAGSDIQMHWSSPSGVGTVYFWFNSVSTELSGVPADPVFVTTSGTQFTIGNGGSSASPVFTITGLTSGAIYMFMATFAYTIPQADIGTNLGTVNVTWNVVASLYDSSTATGGFSIGQLGLALYQSGGTTFGAYGVPVVISGSTIEAGNGATGTMIPSAGGKVVMH